MLDVSSINSFDSDDIKTYTTDPKIAAMANLVDAFHYTDVEEFESSLLDASEGKVIQ